ncbi:Arf GTPase activating protein [Piromyces finnis]|uniref:Arf GTPase activating protein n=1 Tax=Piromyces finnis TaxID=1754191 RepID=A0A1Y1V644_9FUNG|nr:Arf GTPase activating protein [Piromyces finnis]|eukprot:ORX47539.1 Arf GTPase activating protein [Piromyces finnis]
MDSFQLKKQNEKNERTIRNLMKLEENKKCFDCNSSLISYVNLSLNTFVCAECGGLLREINHKIKGISFTIFTEEDVIGLKNGGNKKAREIWLSKWNDFEELNYNEINIEQQRDHIRKKYISKLWYSPPNNINNKENETYKNDISNMESYKTKKLSQYFNENTFIGRNKPFSSKSSSTKYLMNSHNNIDLNIPRKYSFNNFNSYILLDDDNYYNNNESNKNINTFKLSEDLNPSINIYSNTDAKNKIYNYINKDTQATDISIEVINNIKQKTKESYNSFENNISENQENYENQINHYIYNNKQNNKNNSNSFNANKHINNKINDKNNTFSSNSFQKQQFNDYPNYAPRSSSLLNKSLIDSVLHTKNNYLIDNKKVYFYRKKKYHSSKNITH